MIDFVKKLVTRLCILTFGLFNFFLYLGISVTNGSFFQRESEKDRLELALARDRFWNLSKACDGLVHRFFTLRSGSRLHYLTNNPDNDPAFSSRPLLLFLHGFPDSCFVWRHLFRTSAALEDATVVAVDLPGFGGSDSFQYYGATEVLEALTEFIAEIRERYFMEPDQVAERNGAVESDEMQSGKVYIVGHDWGCVLAFRLAAEAPYLADRFIATNGPHPHLAVSNKDRILHSASKMVRTCLHAPFSCRVCLRQISSTVKPLVKQVFLFGYIFAFQLPPFLVRYLLTGGNRAFLRGAHRVSHGRDPENFKPAEAMACTLGPSEHEFKTSTIPDEDGKTQQYPPSVLQRAKQGNAIDVTAYYRDGAALQPWGKSLETLGALHNIEQSYGDKHPRRQSSSAMLFDEALRGALKAPTTIVWGQKDMAVTQELCLSGIGDYLAKRSQVIMLPRTGHWTPLEVEGCAALSKIIQEVVSGRIEEEDIGASVRNMYKGASVQIKK